MSDNGSIFLEAEEQIEPETLKGRATVNIFYNNTAVENEPIAVQLYKSFGTGQGSFVEETTTVTGQAVFEAEPGKYFIKSSSTGRFAAAQSNEFTVRANSDSSITIVLEEKIIGQIKVRVRNQSGQLISDTRVSLLSGNTEIEFREAAANNNTKV